MNLKQELKEPIDYDNLCDLVITELIGKDPKWKEMTMGFRFNKYPQYDAVYKAIHNVVKRRVKKLNKKTKDRKVAVNERSAFESSDDDESESDEIESSESDELPQNQVQARGTTQVTPGKSTQSDPIDPDEVLVEIPLNTEVHA